MVNMCIKPFIKFYEFHGPMISVLGTRMGSVWIFSEHFLNLRKSLLSDTCMCEKKLKCHDVHKICLPE